MEHEMNKVRPEKTFHRRWDSHEPPNRILAIRFHAIGDVAITFPSCASLRNRFPGAQFDFLTGIDSEELPRTTGLFDEIVTVPIATPRRRRLQAAAQIGLRLRERHYDVILDLQRNWMSRLIRIAASPRAWAEFDRFSALPAGVRTQAVFHAVGFADLEPMYAFPISTSERSRAESLLVENGWNRRSPLVVLNPAGLWESRNWPMSSYRDLGGMWLSTEEVQFLLLGTDRVRAKAAFLQQEFGTSVVNLVERTSLGTALAVLQHAALVVSEDSGLLHMSWASGIPTIALFGSSRSDWSRPLGSHTFCFSSHDLDCGECMEPLCRFGDVHCLTRHSPEMVFQAARQLLSKCHADSHS